jgi:5-methyltetrahydropteroyltriglutamate--homocysteine methyltransferase
MVCTAPISYRGHAQLQTDIDNLKAALDGSKPVEVFMPAISPTSAADWQRNAYYETEDDYLFAIADALREEYEAIVAAGFLLQVDDPHLVTYWIKEPELSLSEFRKWAQVRVEALNHALRNIPPEKIRHHTCHGINMGPRVHDLELERVIDIVLMIRAGAIRSRPPIRVTSTNGSCGRRSGCRPARCSFPASSATRPCWWSIPSSWPSASCATPRLWDATT